MPLFVPNYTGYDLDQQGIDWYELFDAGAPNGSVTYVRNFIC